jgi:hypothetical protein
MPRHQIESDRFFWICRFRLLSISSNMDTKLTGDIAEQAAVLDALKQGWGVLKPVGGRLPCDLDF